jgi:hypothetical protein
MRKSMVTAALLALLLADMLLVVLAVRHARGDATQSNSRAGVTAVDEGRTEPASPGLKPIADAARPEEWRVAMADDGTTIVGRASDCASEGRTSVQVSAAPASGDAAGSLESAEVLLVGAGSADEIHVVTADADCDVRSYTSADLGKSWQVGAPAGTWYRDPENADVVQAPGGPSRPGCSASEVHPIDARLARVTCADGLIVGTADGGEQWIRLGELRGAHATVFTTPSNAVALAPVSGCGAQALLTRDGGRTWDAGGCIASDGIEGIASNGATLLARVGGELYTSADNAESWTQP